MKAYYKNAVTNTRTNYLKTKRGNMNREDVQVRREAAPTIKYEPVKHSDNMFFDIDVLKKLYTIHSPSSREGRLGRYIIALLRGMGVQHTVGSKGEIYNIKPGLPLLCVHTDQVQSKPCTHTIQNNNFIYGMGGHKQSGLGADDKNGVWILLNLIKKYGDKVSFLFSTMEEVGGMTDGFMHELGKTVTDTIPYALVFDRKGGSDIIGFDNEYCMKDLNDDIAKLGVMFGYEPAIGVWSDCDHISKYVPCANLSCGYYAPHSDNEYTNINELINALDFGAYLLENLNGCPYDRVEKKPVEIRRWKNGYTPSMFRTSSASKPLKEEIWERYTFEDELLGAMDNKPIDSGDGVATYTEEMLVDFMEDENYVYEKYGEFDILHAVDGFYLSTPDGCVLITDRTELAPGELLEIIVSELFSIFIVNEEDFGYDAWIMSNDDNFQEELTYRDARK